MLREIHVLKPGHREPVRPEDLVVLDFLRDTAPRSATSVVRVMTESGLTPVQGEVERSLLVLQRRGLATTRLSEFLRTPTGSVIAAHRLLRALDRDGVA